MKPELPRILRPVAAATPEMTTHTAMVTPDEAAATLKAHTNVRRLNEGRVRALASDMAAGAWKQNHPQGLLFDCHGKLADGQHRLAAQVRAGITLSWRVTVNVPDDMLGAADTGLARNASIGLAVSLGGEKSHWDKATRVVRIIRAADNFNTVLSNAEFAAIIQSLQEPRVDSVYDHSGKPRLNAPTLAAFVYAWPCSPVVEELWHSVLDGAPPPNVSAEYQQTYAVLLGAITRRIGVRGLLPRDSFFMVCRCIKAIIDEEGLQLAKAFPAAYKGFTEQRRRLGKLPAYPVVKR